MDGLRVVGHSCTHGVFGHIGVALVELGEFAGEIVSPLQGSGQGDAQPTAWQLDVGTFSALIHRRMVFSETLSSDAVGRR